MGKPIYKTSTLLLLLVVVAASSSSQPPLQLVALLSLKSSLADPLSSLRDWTTSSSLCSWTGVACDATTGSIISLDISRRNLSGTIAPEIRYLSHTLRNLNLSRNSFHGPLPTPLLRLRRLTSLDVSHNDFNSTFPDSSLSGLPSLTHLDAYSNSFTGPLPPSVARLAGLRHLNLGGSYFTGEIPAGIGNLARLQYLHLAGNLLGGRVPPELGGLAELRHFEIGYNTYDGGIPAEIGGLKNLQYFDVSSANLSGEIPPSLSDLAKLESLFLFKNRLSGEIPVELLLKLQALKMLDLSDNRLSGRIPTPSLHSNITLLNLMNNELSGEIPEAIGDLGGLEVLFLWNNSLAGRIPPHLGSTGRLEQLDLSSNALTGPIPADLCVGNRLARLVLFSNQLDSGLPLGLARCSALWRVRIQGNRLSGRIPEGFGRLRNLTYVDVSGNNFSGDLPRDLAAAPRLEFLNVSGNPLGAPLPATIWGSPSLQIFSAASCGLKGQIPEFGGCLNLYKIELGDNGLSGSVPTDIGRCRKLLSLKLERNSLDGEIPEELPALPFIADVDLSWNKLTGRIPAGFDSCGTLDSLNLSFNRLDGPVPSSGPVLRNLHPSSFLGNSGLCGPQVHKPCGGTPARAMYSRPSAIVWIAAAVLGSAMVVLVVGMRWVRGREEDGPGPGPGQGPWRMTAFVRLNFTADDVVERISGSEGTVIGVGSTSTVYRAEMPGGEVIAVKKLWKRRTQQPQPQQQHRKGVTRKLGEIEVLGSVRHRNIVRLLGCCENRETTLLMYEYMQNGSLDELLHQAKGEKVAAADWATRYRIAVGVAQGISYLHHDCCPVIVHRDLKPSNILIDGEMEARVADFGVAKLIQAGDKSMSVVAGSYGYLAPEYAYTLKVDEKSDVYSYGVVLMELLSGRRPAEAEFREGRSIVEWVRERVRTNGEDVVFEAAAGSVSDEAREEMMLVLRVALLCANQNPSDRPSMRDVVSMLREAKPDVKAKTVDGSHKLVVA